MASLSNARLAPLHKRFVEAAERFPAFHVAAICEVLNPDWPGVPDGDGLHPGLHEATWNRILGKLPGQNCILVSTDWTWFDRGLWQCAFFDASELGDDLKAQYGHGCEAMGLFRCLAAEAVGAFSLPDQNPSYEFPGRLTPTGAWLAQVCMLVGTTDLQDGGRRLIVRFDSNAFAQSARTLERLVELQEAISKAKESASMPLLEDQPIHDLAGLVALIDALNEYARWGKPPTPARRIVNHLRDGRNDALRIPGFPVVAWEKLPDDYPKPMNDPGSDLAALSQWARSKAGTPAVAKRTTSEKGPAMRPPVQATIRPHLEAAIRDIDTFLDARKKQEEAERDLCKLFDQMAAGKTPRGVKGRGKPVQLTEKQQAALAGLKPNCFQVISAEQAEALAELGGKPMSDEEWDAMQFALRGGWRESARKAAAWLRDAGETVAANGIGVELSQLPDEPRDASELQAYRDTTRQAAQQVKAILAACLEEAVDYPAGSGRKQRGPASDADAKTKRKPKRSTERGEARAKLIAALTKHHNYSDGGCLNLEPVGNNELADRADVDKATASEFFKKEFKGHGKYKAACADAGRLAAALKLLNGEFSPHLLYGAKPPGEGEPNDE